MGEVVRFRYLKCVCRYVGLKYYSCIYNEDFANFETNIEWTFKDIFVSSTIWVYVPCKNIHAGSMLGKNCLRINIV